MGIETTARSRELGAELKRHRDNAGLTCEQVGAMMGVSANTVSRMERGHRVPSEIEATIFLAVCGVGRREIDDLLAICREGESDRCWLRPHSGRIADEMRTLVFNEANAIALTNFEPLLVPGLLQSTDYAGAVIRGLVSRPEAAEDKVAARVSRQAVVLRAENPPECQFFINEVALQFPVGGPRVMQEQMLRLMFLADRPNIKIRVVPTSAGAHAGMRGAFIVLHSAEHRPIVHVESETASLFHENYEDVEVYRIIAIELSRCALDEGESRSLFAELANKYDQALGGCRDGVANQHLH